MRHDQNSLDHMAGAANLMDLSRQMDAARAAATKDAAPLISARVVSSLVRSGEGLLVFLTGISIWLLYLPAHLTYHLYLPVIAMASLIVPLLLHMTRTYEISALQNPLKQLTRLSLIWIVLFGVLAASLFFTKISAEFSRGWFGLWYGIGFAILVAYRTGISLLIRHWNRHGQLSRRAVLVGGGEAAENVLKAIADSKDTDITIVGIFDDRNDDRSPPMVAGTPKLGTIDQLVDFVRKTRVDLLIITFPLTAENRLIQIVRRLWVLPTDIRLSAYAQKLRYRPRAYSYIGNVPFLDVFDKPLTDWNAFLKAASDKVISAFLLVILSPIMLAVAIAIKLESKGPVFFLQNRFGFNNELIKVIKFRSMYTDMTDRNAEKLVSKGDPRVTKVGRFIRKTSIDELPQLINVLKGDLSLVGPRPHPTMAKAGDRLYDEVVEEYFARHKVKPGITGWAQINGWRGETDTAEKIQRRVEHDLYYIENWSLFFDLYILIKTPFALMNTENAY
jgi:Undecaprenyl-phosphate glucose phosphotransferase